MNEQRTICEATHKNPNTQELRQFIDCVVDWDQDGGGLDAFMGEISTTEPAEYIYQEPLARGQEE